MSSPAQNSTPVPRSMTYAAAASASASTSAAAAVPVTTPFAVTSPRNNNESVPVAGRATAPYCSPQAHGGEFQHPLGISRPFAQMAYTHRNTRRHAAAEPVAPVRRRPGSSASFSVPAGRPSTDRVNLSAMTGTAGPAVQIPAAQIPAAQIPAAQIPAAQIPAAQVSATEQHQQAGGSFSGAIGVEREAGTLELTDVPQRRVLATTLAVVRSRVAGLVAKHPDSLDAWQINEFLKRVFPRGGQADTIHCSVLSAVETSYRYPVSDEDWKLWLKIVEHIPEAKVMEDALAVGHQAFDEVNSTFQHARHLAQHAGAPEQLLPALVQFYNLNKKFDVNFNGRGGDDRNQEP